MIEALFEKLNGALSKNTLRAYRSDYTHFTTWCQKQDVEPLAHEPTAMLDYLTHMASQSSVATIVRRLASLSSIFKYLCITDTTKDIDVCLALKKIKRQKGTAQQQAEPLTKSHIEKMLPHYGKGIVGLRNQVLLHLGHQTMRRRSDYGHFTNWCQTIGIDPLVHEPSSMLEYVYFNLVFLLAYRTKRCLIN